MTEQLPDPFVPPEVDLNGYEFMPLYGERLRTSAHNSRCSDAEYRASINIWWSSWMQVPAASLPQDDAELCRLADLGRDLKTWLKVKPYVMRNFVLCNDGRFYHRFLSVLALDAWAQRVKARVKGKQGAAKRWSSHRKNVPEPVDKDGRATDSACPGQQETMPQLQQSDATAIQNDSKREEILSRNNVQGRDSTAPLDATPSHERRKASCPRVASDTPEQANLRAEGWRLGIEPYTRESWDQFKARIRITRAA
jgi:hypothetical protein